MQLASVPKLLTCSGSPALTPTILKGVTHRFQLDSGYPPPEGHLVVVEVKLWGNPEARRKVVAQTLEYATALFKLSYGCLRCLLLVMCTHPLCKKGAYASFSA